MSTNDSKMAFQIVPFWNDDFFPWKRPRYQLSQLFGEIGSLNEGRSFELALDVQGFDSKELQVNLQDNYLTVSGNHEEKSDDDDSFISRSFVRKYQLPHNVNQKSVRSSLINNGKTLKIEAPLDTNLSNNKPIPIEINRADDVGMVDK